MQIPVLLFVLSIYITKVISECPNACSGHGTCGAYDMCLCYRNWMANDCSERICQFGLAFADTPKGDLDASGEALTGPGVTVAVNSFIYPFGTTEQFPSMTDTEGNILTNSAHYYSECSNAGICDRASGICDCFEGYEGSGCQRASCPSNSDGICSGHGVCKTIREIAVDDNDNVYRLWDMDSSLGCVCDGGYSGADCSERVCKFGADPLYSNDYQTVRYSNYTYQIYTETSNSKVYGNYSLVFYDAFGEDWQTEAISIHATCNDVTSALEALPNSVIPNNSVLCYNKGSLYTDDEITSLASDSIVIQNRFTIAFSGNPGRLEQIDINIYLDGNRPTLYTNETTSTLGYHIYPNGFQGEYTDYVNTLCEDVYVTLSTGTTYDTLTALNDYQTKLLKKCLGDADGSTSNNVEVYNWDYGSAHNPHLIKLVDATEDNYTTLSFYEITDSTQIGYPVTRLCSTSNNVIQGYGSTLGAGWCPNYNPAGFYVVLFYDSFTSLFKILTRPSHDYATTTKFHVFTTTGWLQIVNPQSAAFTVPLEYTTTQKIEHAHSNILYLTNLTNSYFEFYGQLDCLSTTIGVNGALDCLNKNDFVMVLNSNVSLNGHASNPIYPNLYQVAKVYHDEPTSVTSPTSKYLEYKVTLDYNLNAMYAFATGYKIGGLDSLPYKYEYTTAASIYKFHVPTDNSEYTYTAQCSNRGLCDKSTGVCDCFNGFTNDNCNRQNALAI